MRRLPTTASLNFATGDTVSIFAYQIDVNGTMTATGATFTNGGDSPSVQFGPSGIITPADSTFKVPIYLPYNDIASLAGNVSFDQIEINLPTLPSGALDLNSIGTNTTNLTYIFPDAFTVESGATLNVGAYVSVQINATFIDDGLLNFATGDTVSIFAYQIDVNGTMTATGATFTNGGDSPSVQFGPSGIITPADSTFNVPIYLPYNDVASLAGNVSFDQIEINLPTLPSGALDLDSIGTNTTNLTYIFPDAFTVESGATLNVGAYVSVQINATFTDDGLLNFATGDTVSIFAYQIDVNGTMTATGATFTNGGDSPSVQFGPSGIITPADSTFKVPIYLPYNDIASLAGNVSFDQIEINSPTLPSGALDLNSIGTNTTNLTYIFPDAFTVESGATLNVGAYVSVQINATFTDDGLLSFATGDTVSIFAYQIDVNGTMTATGATFANGGDSPGLTIKSGGSLLANDETKFNLSSVTLDSGSSATLSSDVLYNVLTINSHSAINIAENDFSNLATSNGLVATGDPNATIDLEDNYWGTTVVSQIEAIILDHRTDPTTRPTVDYSNFVSNSSGTKANPVSVTFSTSTINFTLKATVFDSAGDIISAGTETFSILNGTQVIGQQITVPADVKLGAVSATYQIPPSTPPGQYIIEATYSGSPGVYLPSTDTSQLLTVNPAPATQLQIETSPSSPATAGQTFTPQPVIYEEDQYGDVETGDNSTVVSVSLATGSGLLGTSTATVVGGVATFTNLRDDTAGQSITLQFTSGSLTPAISSNIVINPAPADQVVFGQQPTNTTAGVAITPAVTVKVEDAYGNVITTDTSTVTLTLSSGTFAGGSNTVTAKAVNGVATFSSLTIDAAGNYTLTATDGSLSSSGASNGFTISPAAASKVVFSPGPSNTAAGVAITPAVAVWVEDQYGNVVTSDSSTVTLTLSTGTFAGGSNTTTGQAANGVVSFPSLIIDTQGNYTLAATDGKLTPSGASTSFTISPAPASKVVFGSSRRTRPPAWPSARR